MNDSVFELLQLAPFVAALLLPGFLWKQSERKFISQVNIGKIEEVYSYVLYSLLAYTVAIWCSGEGITDVESISELSISSAFELLLIGGGAGMLGGIFTGLARKFDLLGSVFSRIRITTIHPFDTAWDKAFGKSKHCIVRVTFKNGTNRYGMFANKSLVSTESSERDIFLETAYIDDPQNGLIPEYASGGIWIPHGEIECVRFYNYEELKNDESRKHWAEQWYRRNPTFERGDEASDKSNPE